MQEFKVVGGCKVKNTTSSDNKYREIKIVMHDFEDKVFEIGRYKGGGITWSNTCEADVFWLRVQLFQFPFCFTAYRMITDGYKISRVKKFPV